MKVLLVNGSPHEKGCTYTALAEVASALESEGVKTTIFHIGAAPVGGCIACRACAARHECVFEDAVNVFTELAAEYDGFVFGTPVYYAGMSGSFTSFMDRAFFSAGSKTPNPFAFKPAAAVVSARRAGTTATFDAVNKYFAISQMPIVTSRYWNMVHGNTPDEVRRDEEGMQVMRMLGRNMAWMLRLKAAGERAGVTPPAPEATRYATNFIR